MSWIDSLSKQLKVETHPPEGSASIDSLCHRTGLSRGRMSEIMRRLVADSMFEVVRVKRNGRPVNFYRPTKAGQKLLEEGKLGLPRP